MQEIFCYLTMQIAQRLRELSPQVRPKGALFYALAVFKKGIDMEQFLEPSLNNIKTSINDKGTAMTKY